MRLTKIYIVICLLVISGYSSDFEKYKKSSVKNFSDYKKNLKSSFEIYREKIAEFKKIVLKSWPKFETTTPKVWVKYEKDLKSKSIIDYKNRQIKFEVFAKNEKEAKRKFLLLFENIVNKDIKNAFKDDFIEKSINKKLPNSNQKLLIFLNQEKILIDKQIKQTKPKYTSYNKSKIYKTTIKFSSKSFLRLALNYKENITKYSKKYKIQKELIYAIIETESSFNPMARSLAPAFGLMQIVPFSGGNEAYKFLYGYDKNPSPTFLYNPDNNIMIGTAYLHILYYNYFKNIKDKTSRLYCTISAYNAGVGNVAKVFSSKDIKRALNNINAYQADEVYKVLIHNLPKEENREYIKNVLFKMEKYQNLGEFIG